MSAVSVEIYRGFTISAKDGKVKEYKVLGTGERSLRLKTGKDLE